MIKRTLTILIAVLCMLECSFAKQVYGPVKSDKGINFKSFVVLQKNDNVVTIWNNNGKDFEYSKKYEVGKGFDINKLYSELDSHNFTKHKDTIFIHERIKEFNTDDEGTYIVACKEKIYIDEDKNIAKKILAELSAPEPTYKQFEIDMLPILIPYLEISKVKYNTFSMDYPNGFNWKNYRKYKYDHFTINPENGDIVCFKGNIEDYLD